MKTKRRKTSAARDCVLLRFPLEQATRVCIAGTFNAWDPEATPLEHDGNSHWCASLDLAPGRYEYRLVVDGVWTDPPGADERVENAFGSRNAVLQVAVAAPASANRSALLSLA